MIADEKKQQQNLANSVQKTTATGATGRRVRIGHGRASRVEEVRQAVQKQPKQPKQRVAAHARRIHAERQGREQLADEPGRGWKPRGAGHVVGGEEWVRRGQAPAGEARGAGGDKQKVPAAHGGRRAREDRGQSGQQEGHREAIMPCPRRGASTTDQDGAISRARLRRICRVRHLCHVHTHRRRRPVLWRAVPFKS